MPNLLPTTLPTPALPCSSHPPAPEFEGAVLPVEGEEVDVDGTGAAEDGGWQPVDIARVVDEDVAVVGYLKEPIIAVPGESRADGHGEPWARTGHSLGRWGGETEAWLTCSLGLSQAATACLVAGGAPQCPQTQTYSTAGGNRSIPERGHALPDHTLTMLGHPEADVSVTPSCLSLLTCSSHMLVVSVSSTSFCNNSVGQ